MPITLGAKNEIGTHGYINSSDFAYISNELLLSHAGVSGVSEVSETPETA